MDICISSFLMLLAGKVVYHDGRHRHADLFASRPWRKTGKSDSPLPVWCIFVY